MSVLAGWPWGKGNHEEEFAGGQEPWCVARTSNGPPAQSFASPVMSRKAEPAQGPPRPFSSQVLRVEVVWMLALPIGALVRCITEFSSWIEELHVAKALKRQLDLRSGLSGHLKVACGRTPWVIGAWLAHPRG